MMNVLTVPALACNSRLWNGSSDDSKRDKNRCRNQANLNRRVNRTSSRQLSLSVQC